MARVTFKLSDGREVYVGESGVGVGEKFAIHAMPDPLPSRLIQVFIEPDDLYRARLKALADTTLLNFINVAGPIDLDRAGQHLGVQRKGLTAEKFECESCSKTLRSFAEAECGRCDDCEVPF